MPRSRISRIHRDRLAEGGEVVPRDGEHVVADRHLRKIKGTRRVRLLLCDRVGGGLEHHLRSRYRPGTR
jgi:hypothetical protein